MRPGIIGGAGTLNRWEGGAAMAGRRGRLGRSRHALRGAVLAVLAGLSTAGAVIGVAVASGDVAGASNVTVKVVGNQLVDGSGAPLRLLGVDRSGSEYACAQGFGIFDGPSDAASVTAMAAWHIDAVRVPLNEDCWLGINGVNANYSGTNYQTAIESYVSLLNSEGLVAVLDLHWNAPGTTLAQSQQLMADADHSPAFWTSVATAFRTNPGVVFDLYNEPHDISWSCWLNGCATSAGWQAAGMQSLLNAVRATGATQPVMVAGLNWAGDLSQWLANEPVDPLHQLVASAHIYNFSQCNTESCWNQTIAPVAAKVPVVTGELGETDCAPSFINSYMSWADSVGVSYLGWAWDSGGGWSCSNGPSLITDYQGDPTPYGAGLRTHLAALGSGGTGSGGTGSGGTGSGGTGSGGTGSGGTGSGVSVAYSVTNQWSGGFQAQLSITNGSSSALGSAAQPWTLSFSLPSATVTSLWNGNLSTVAGSTAYTVTGPSWETSIAPGSTWNVGFVANGTSSPPTGCLLDGNACTIGAPGQPAPAPAASIRPSTMSFGPTTVLTTANPQTLSVSNGGNAPLAISTVTLGGAGAAAFRVQADTCSGSSVAPGASCTVTLAFAPATVGTFSATVSVADNAAGSPQLTALSGTSSAPPPPPPPPPPPGTGVSVAYSVVNQWPGGYQAQLVVTNTSPGPLGTAAAPWTLSFATPSNDVITNLWNGQVASTSVGGSIDDTVTAPSWAPTLASGASWTIGFTANGTSSVPTNCVVGGSACAIAG